MRHKKCMLRSGLKTHKRIKTMFSMLVICIMLFSCVLTVRAAVTYTDPNARPSGDIFNNWNRGGVLSSPEKPTVFTVDKLTYIAYIVNYHWNGGSGSASGTISLKDQNGTVYGPWTVSALSGANEMKNVVWFVSLHIVIPAGTYTVIDSDPSTWSCNPDSNNKGFTEIRGDLSVDPATVQTAVASSGNSVSDSSAGTDSTAVSSGDMSGAAASGSSTASDMDEAPAGVGSVGNIPGPDTAGQAAAGILIPGFVSLILGSLGTMLGGGGLSSGAASLNPLDQSGGDALTATGNSFSVGTQTTDPFPVHDTAFSPAITINQANTRASIPTSTQTSTPSTHASNQPKTASTSKASAVGASGSSDPWKETRTTAKMVMDDADKLWGSAGQKAYNKILDSVHTAMDIRPTKVYETAARMGSSSSMKTALKTMQRIESETRAMKSLGNTISKSFSVGGMMSDAIESMTDRNRDDGTLLEGDSIFKATAKSYIANTICGTLLESSPLLTLTDVLMTITVGNTDGGSIFSPSNIIKGVINANIDAATDFSNTADRAKAGFYGDYLKNIAASSEMLGQTVEDTSLDETASILTSDSYYDNMKSSSNEMWSDKEGNMGITGSAFSSITDFAIDSAHSIANTAQDLSKAAGTLYENTSYAIRSYFE
jgi:hypothetical protein